METMLALCFWFEHGSAFQQEWDKRTILTVLDIHDALSLHGLLEVRSEGCCGVAALFGRMALHTVQNTFPYYTVFTSEMFRDYSGLLVSNFWCCLELTILGGYNLNPRSVTVWAPCPELAREPRAPLILIRTNRLARIDLQENPYFYRSDRDS